MFTKHILAIADPLPAIEPTSILEYVFAGNGVYVRAHRKGLEAMIPVSSCEIRGLLPVKPYARLEGGRVPLVCTQSILEEFRRDLPNESLVWVKQSEGMWMVVKPRQIQTGVSVRPVDPFDPGGTDALLDVHSHNTMEPFFSIEDDKDETGFRIFAVFGLLDTRPCVAARIGIYDYCWRLNAGDVFVLPNGIKDASEVLLEQAGLKTAGWEVEGQRPPLERGGLQEICRPGARLT